MPSSASTLPRPRPVLVAGAWRAAEEDGTFRASRPATGEPIDDVYPVSGRADLERALEAGRDAALDLVRRPAEDRARFLERYAERLDARAGEIAACAHEETGLALSPRLRDVELPRTSDQLRQAAAAARTSSWTLPTIDTAKNIRSLYEPLAAPVAVFGPNNFPLAFNGVAGGDFAAAVGAGNPVIAKANTSHPATSRLLAEEAFEAVKETGLPAATVQLVYRMAHDDGRWLVSHPLLGATGYTGSRSAGLELKAAADAAGKPIYLELSSVNPVFILPGALRERGGDIAGEFAKSALMGTGQFCTNPGVVVLLDGQEADEFTQRVREAFDAAEPGPLLGSGTAIQLAQSVAQLEADGARRLTGGNEVDGPGYRYRNTLLEVDGASFLRDPQAFQREAFGNSSLLVRAAGAEDAERIASSLEGNLTGCIYSHSGGEDDALYDRIAFRLRPRVGRLLNDKMPTGVAVSPAMNHGGPYPATGHPGFTAVGIPASLRRFAQLACYDGVREHRLPPELRDRNPGGRLWRYVDGTWTTGEAGGG